MWPVSEYVNTSSCWMLWFIGVWYSNISGGVRLTVSAPCSHHLKQLLSWHTLGMVSVHRIHLCPASQLSSLSIRPAELGSRWQSRQERWTSRIPVCHVWPGVPAPAEPQSAHVEMPGVASKDLLGMQLRVLPVGQTEAAYEGQTRVGRCFFQTPPLAWQAYRRTGCWEEIWPEKICRRMHYRCARSEFFRNALDVMKKGMVICSLFWCR